MSVPAPLRKKSSLEAQIKTDDMVMHTLTIFSNPKVFNPRFQKVADIVIGLCLDISQNIWNANLVKVRKHPKRWEKRHDLQSLALDQFDRLLTLARICRRLYHLKSGKYEAWIDKICIAQDTTKSWVKSDMKRYGYLSGKSGC